jgi:hypothetical protein
MLSGRKKSIDYFIRAVIVHKYVSKTDFVNNLLTYYFYFIPLSSFISNCNKRKKKILILIKLCKIENIFIKIPSTLRKRETVVVV